MLQKTVVKRKNKIVVGISYDYSIEEVEEFMLAKVFKDCGYHYNEIKDLMDKYRENNVEVIDEAIKKTKCKIEELKKALKNVNELRKKLKCENED
ncbi:MAG: hypothetical protein K6G48_05795 [Acholeplasmatales bacterium]|nr:hypothetical protein [Acholeplasmatales bacterium]